MIVNDLIKMIADGQSPSAVARIAINDNLVGPVRAFSTLWSSTEERSAYGALLRAVNAAAPAPGAPIVPVAQTGTIAPTGTTEGQISNRPCEICGHPGHWNSGAAQTLCPRHWDSY